MEIDSIAIVGAGYVGMSMAVLLASRYHVIAIDIDQSKVEQINKRISPVKDPYIERYMTEKELHLQATCNASEAYRRADLIIVAVPTDYSEQAQGFNTEILDSVIAEAHGANPGAVIVIRSTVPVGYTQRACERYRDAVILFSPEFLRESRALYDNLHPSRIIVGCSDTPASRQAAEAFANLLKESTEEENVPVLVMANTEAEAVKLFANTYLAMRVSFFNELDTFAEIRGLNTQALIQGVCLDPRIGDYYNNPSFGYGGYCLPKDTRQLLADYSDMPQSLVKATVEANRIRMNHIAEQAMKKAGKEHPVIGIWRLAMKEDSDDIRHSSIQGVMRRLQEKGAQVVIYEPSLPDGSLYRGSHIVNDVDTFKKESDLILVNRFQDDLQDVADKVYTRDLFNRD